MVFNATVTVEEFVSSGACDLTLPASLTKEQRAAVHQAAKMVGITATSTGVHPKRAIRLSKGGLHTSTSSWLAKADAAAAAAGLEVAGASVKIKSDGVRAQMVDATSEAFAVDSAPGGGTKKRKIDLRAAPAAKLARAPPRQRTSK